MSDFIEKLNGDIWNCDRCDLQCTVKSRITNIKEGGVLILSDFVTQEQYEHSKKLVGEDKVSVLAYQYTETLNALSNLFLDDFKHGTFGFSDIYHCYPHNKSTNRKRVPRSEEIRNCLPFTNAFIANIKPSYIVFVGNVALNALSAEKFTIMKDYGKMISVGGYKGYIFPKPCEEMGTEFYILFQQFKKDVQREHPELLKERV